MDYTADQVWGLAVRADAVNSGYLKEDRWGFADSGESKLLNRANKSLVKDWLTNNQQPTAEEIEQGRKYREFFKGYTLKALMGNLSDFDKQALRISQMEGFKKRDFLELAIVGCLPASARREQQRLDIKREVFASSQLRGNVGDRVEGEIEVVAQRYSQQYNKFKITARMGESYVDFWFSRQLEAGHVARIKGKIKNQRGDNTTQLNFVKLVG